MEALNELIQNLYQTVYDDQAWNAVSDDLQRLTNANKTVFAVRKWSDMLVGDHHVYGFEDKAFDLYENYYFKVDLWTAGLARMPMDRFHAHHDFLRDQSFLNSEVYTDYAKTNDIRHLSGCITDLPGTGKFAQLSAVRGHGSAPFDDDILRKLDLLAPHFRQALLLSQRVEALQDNLTSRESMINRLLDAVFILGPDARILYHNAAAEKLLSAARVKKAGNKLTLPNRRATDQLHRAVRYACHAVSGSVEKEGRDDQAFCAISENETLDVAVFPFRHRLSGDASSDGRASALVVITPNEAEIKVHKSIIKALYGLTDSETDIVQYLCRGLSPRDIASRRSVSLETVRTQIRAIHQKVGCTSQSQLVAKVLGGISRFSS